MHLTENCLFQLKVHLESKTHKWEKEFPAVLFGEFLISAYLSIDIGCLHMLPHTSMCRSFLYTKLGWIQNAVTTSPVPIAFWEIFAL